MKFAIAGNRLLIGLTLSFVTIDIYFFLAYGVHNPYFFALALIFGVATFFTTQILAAWMWIRDERIMWKDIFWLAAILLSILWILFPSGV